MSWEKMKLESVCSSISDGDHNAPPKAKWGIPFITISNLDSSDGIIDFGNTAYVPQTYYEALKPERKPQRNDILYSVVGSFGIPVLIREEKEFVFQRHIAIIRPNNRVVPEYLYYLMKSPDFYHWADNVAVGATQRTVTLGLLRNKVISVPPVKVQEHIAAVLSVYDKLIENNRKQIKLLEEAADLFYFQWLESCDKSSFKMGVLSDYFDVTIGKTPPRSQTECFTQKGGIPWVSVKDLGSISGPYINETNEQLTQEAVDQYNVRVKPSGTILLSFKLTIGRVAIANRPVTSNEAIAHFVTDDDAIRLYTYEYLRHFKYETLGSTSSIGKAINSKIVKMISYKYPGRTNLESLYLLLSPLFESMNFCQKRIGALREARDRLLPKLMSGEIEV